MTQMHALLFDGELSVYGCIIPSHFAQNCYPTHLSGISHHEKEAKSRFSSISGIN
jgi:hypothetical protein